MRSTEKLIAVKSYAKHGWRIIPLHGIKSGKCTCGKKNCKSAGKHPLIKNWVQKSSCDYKVIKGWLEKYPDCNIGGMPPPGFLVIDIDGKQGKSSYSDFKIETKTAKSITKRGSHMIFEGDLPKSVIDLNLGIDVITDDRRKYVVLPPSKRIDSKRYRWGKRSIIGKMTESEQNKMLCFYDETSVIDFLNPPGFSFANIQPKPSNNHSIFKKGGRNNQLTSIAGALRRQNLDEETIFQSLLSINEFACKPPLDEEEVQNIAKSIAKYKSSIDDVVQPSEAIKCLADIEATEPRFLVDPYVVYGSVTILEGDPSCGKSTLLAELVACVSTGKNFCGIKPNYTGSVLFFAFEDDISSVFKKRAMFQGADQSKIHFVDHDDVDLGDVGFEFLEQALSERKYAVVIIDTLTSALGDKHDMNKGTHMAKVLNRLRRLAETYDTSIIAVRHFRKGGSDNALYAGSGSVAITGAARSVLMVKVSPEDDDLRFLAHSKSNGVERGKTLQFRIKETPNSRIGTLHWDGQSPLMAEELLTFNSDNEKDIDVAIKFLKDYLADDAISATALISQAERRSISTRTLNRAKKHLKIISSGGPGSKWSLPK